MPRTSVKMFQPVSSIELIEGLASRLIVALDLPPAHPDTQPFDEDHNSGVIAHTGFLQEQGEALKSVSDANIRLRANNIEGLDLAIRFNDEDYRRPIQGRGPMCLVTTANGRVRIMDYAGKILMDVNPKKFEALPRITPSFELFEDLPIEIRNKIWGLAHEEFRGRTIVACEVGAEGWDVSCAGRSLSQVAKSVQLDLKSSNFVDNVFKNTTGSDFILFDPEKDQLWVTASREIVSRVAPPRRFATGANFSTIRCLTLDLEAMELNFMVAIQHLQSMTSLSVLEVRGRGRASQTNNLYFEFIDLRADESFIVPLVEYPTGVRVAGPQVMNDICQYVEYNLEQERLVHLWEMIAMAYFSVPTMPWNVGVTINYGL